MGHTLLALHSLDKGLKTLTPCQNALHSALDQHWELLAEPIQLMMKKYGQEEAYDTLRHLCQGTKVKKHDIQEFISDLSLPTEEKERLLKLSPDNYIGYAATLAEQIKA